LQGSNKIFYGIIPRRARLAAKQDSRIVENMMKTVQNPRRGFIGFWS